MAAALISNHALGATQSNIGRMKDAGVQVAIGMINDRDSHQLRYTTQYAGNLVSLESVPNATGLSWDEAFAAISSVPAAIAGLGAALATLPGVKAVVWTPATSWIAPDLYRRSIGDWLAGGAFPGLALTALERERNGAMLSHGLHLLIGQEVRFEPDKRLSSATMARLALRLIHELVQSGPLQQERDFKGPDGEHLLAVPVRDGTQVRILLSGLGGGQ